MTNTLRTIYRYWTLLFALAVVVQVGAAAYGAFYSASKLGDQKGSDETKNITAKVFDHGFSFHIALGYIIFLASVLLLLFALGARLGRPRIWWNLAVPILVVIQIALFAWGGENTPVLGFFHGVNALVIAGLAGALASREWRRASPADAATGTAPAPR
jgi:Family of unknown function (DUF6220)